MATRMDATSSNQSCDAVDAMQPVASRSRQPRDDVVLPVGPHGLDAQSQRTMHLTPVLRKGSEIDAVAIADGGRCE